MNVRSAATAVCAAAALACAASPAAADSGSGTYAAQGRSYYFVLTNTGSTALQSFYLVGPPGVTFIGGTTSAEAAVRCVPGQPDGLANEIQCGPPLSTSIAPAHGTWTFAATLAAPAACGAVFQFDVSSTGAQPFTRAADITESGSCTAAAPSALSRPALHGTPRVGRTLTATPPSWSAPPTRVSYRWQRCTNATCSAIANATRLGLTLVRRDAGHSVRLVATALIDGATVESASKKLAVRAG